MGGTGMILVQAAIKELDPEDHFMNALKVEIWYERPVRD